MLTIALDREAKEPIYLQVKHHLIRQIENGVLMPGDRLPATRDMAQALGIGRISVLTAYEELKEEGYIIAHVGRGTFVAERLPGAPESSYGVLPGTTHEQGTALREMLRLAERPGVINFSHGAPADSFLPVALVQKAINTVLERDGAQAVAYEVPEGYPPLRESISQMVRQPGIDVSLDEVLVTGGCQQALDLAIQALLNPGDVMLTSSPTYPGILDIARARGVTAIGIETDDQGMRTETLEAMIIEYRPRLIYVAPTYHNPTGTVMPLHRRRHLLEIAGRYRLPVLEDGVYEELTYTGTPPPPLKALDEAGLVLYANSFSKVLLPGMRIGYLLPGERLYQRVARVKQAADICTPALNQRAIHAILEKGQLAEHLNQVQGICRERRDAMLNALGRYLGEARWGKPDGGLYLWLALPVDGPTAIELYMQAVLLGVAFAPGSLFFTTGGGLHHLRLNMITHPPEQIDEGIRRLGDAWRLLAATYQPPTEPGSKLFL